MVGSGTCVLKRRSVNSEAKGVYKRDVIHSSHIGDSRLLVDRASSSCLGNPLMSLSPCNM